MKKFRIIPILTIMIFSSNILYSQNLVLDLYPKGQIPNYTPTEEKEVRDTTDIVRISSVQTPDIALFFPTRKSTTGEAVIICPGGGYRYLAYDWEGEETAKYWNSKGVTAIVLKYRLPTSISQIEPHKSPLLDAQRAMRLVRYNAEKWNIDPDKIGIMGFSAGGHLASTLSTHFDKGNPNATDPIERMSCRPDFSILLYPVISFTGDFMHSGSRKNLIGENEELAKYYSNELQVTNDTPPTILIHAADDTSVPVENSIVYFQALVKNNVPVEMHIYPTGKHGFSLAIGKKHLDGWPELAFGWLKSL
ncbi:MAG: alpha/beta hydrolase [Bacteroidales bacterium]|nr:alpha/beta hydrolase [Bacteroidales bacterium]MCF8389833.1 alpha/beta hydrolase [Bacteroidales bacterium]